MKLWTILDIDHGCHTFMNMLIYVVILSISWPVLCVRLLWTIVLTLIQIVHLFLPISFYDLPIGWWNYPDGVIFFVFHLILTNVLYLTYNSWAPRDTLQFVKRSITPQYYIDRRKAEGFIIFWGRLTAIWAEMQELFVIW